MNELIRVALLLGAMNTGPAAPAACCERLAPGRVAAIETAQRAADEWFGSDKVPHFWMSYATTAFAFAAASAAGSDSDGALVVGVAAGATAGVGKELHDWRRGRTFSLKDLTVDALGVAAAFFLLREVR